jgi:hypothetical protein
VYVTWCVLKYGEKRDDSGRSCEVRSSSASGQTDELCKCGACKMLESIVFEKHGGIWTEELKVLWEKLGTYPMQPTSSAKPG